MASINVSSCFWLPPNVNSEGALYHDKFGSWLKSSMPRLELMSILIIFMSQACHSVLKHLGLPLFLSQLIAGRMLSLAFENKLLNNTEDDVKVLGTIATLGYAAHVFQIAVKTDLGMLGRAGKKAICIGSFPLIASMICGIIASRHLIKDDKEFYECYNVLVVTTSVTSFPVITSVLEELKIVNSELGRIGQSAALISDILSKILINFTIVIRLYNLVNAEASLGFLGLVLGLLFIICFVFRPALKWIVRHTPTNRRVKNIYIYSIFCIFLVFTSLTKWHRQFTMGPYMLGLAIPNGPPLGSIIAEKFDGLTSGFFMPIFVATCGMREDFDEFKKIDAKKIITYSIVIGITFLAKFGASLAILLYAKFPKRDGCALSLIICTKGFVEMATISFLSDAQLVKTDLLFVMFISVVIIGSFTPILVKFLYDHSRRYTSYEKRTIMHLSPNSNLQILTCIHVPNHVSAVTNLLETSGASGERPIGIHVLHLIKLSGQAAPVFISHDMEKPDFTDNYSYSENVVLSFMRFGANNQGAMSINVSTAISAPNLMYEDICTLALERSASLIVLPFHRRWYLDGSVESEDNSTRVLNRMVLNRAPCSVGILIDRGYKRRLISTGSSKDLTQNVAMIFLGGNDDREALVYAMRMAEDSSVRLTVARLICPDNTGTSSWDEVLDSEVLKDVKSNRHIQYVEHEVKGGPDTSLIIQSMMKEFDIFIVGRAANLKCEQTAGLDDWMEYPELGVIGDMFASYDVEEKFLVLVVQQHSTTLY
ncbi:hypothetical protein ACFE04_003972 [Oxalis oulophora]